VRAPGVLPRRDGGRAVGSAERVRAARCPLECGSVCVHHGDAVHRRDQTGVLATGLRESRDEGGAMSSSSPTADAPTVKVGAVSGNPPARRRTRWLRTLRLETAPTLTVGASAVG